MFYRGITFALRERDASKRTAGDVAMSGTGLRAWGFIPRQNIVPSQLTSVLANAKSGSGFCSVQHEPVCAAAPRSVPDTTVCPTVFLKPQAPCN